MFFCCCLYVIARRERPSVPRGSTPSSPVLTALSAVDCLFVYDGRGSIYLYFDHIRPLCIDLTIICMIFHHHYLLCNDESMKLTVLANTSLMSLLVRGSFRLVMESGRSCRVCVCLVSSVIFEPTSHRSGSSWRHTRLISSGHVPSRSKAKIERKSRQIWSISHHSHARARPPSRRFSI